ILTAKGGDEVRNSVTMTESRKQQMIEHIEDYVANYSIHIPAIKLLEQLKVFGDPHADDDLAIALGRALVMLQSDKAPAKLLNEAPTAPTYRLERVNGLLVPRFDGGSSVVRNVPKNLFDVRR